MMYNTLKQESICWENRKNF